MSLYLTSRDDAVIEAIERNRIGLAAFKARAHEWASERGSEVCMMNSFGRKVWVTGLPEAPEGFGRWTKADRGTSHPYRNNAVETAALDALKFTTEATPGLPSSVYSAPLADGRTYVMWPHPFVWADAAWVSYGHQPEKPLSELFGEQWHECLASEWHAAKEGVEAMSRGAA